MYPFVVAPDSAEYVIPVRAAEKEDLGINAKNNQNQQDRLSSVAKKNATAICTPHLNVSDEQGRWVLSMDVPGVKSDDIEIEEKEGILKVRAQRKNGIRYQQHFVVEKKSADLANLNAELSDGVLTISVPKKPEMMPLKVPVFTEEAPDSVEGHFHVSIDLPGVKTDNLVLKFKDDQLFLQAERKRAGTNKAKIERVFQVTTPADMSQAKAYLCDGVLTVMAPNAIQEEETNASRLIPVGVSTAKPVIETVNEDE